MAGDGGINPRELGTRRIMNESTQSSSPEPLVPDPDPTHTPVIPEPDPTHTPTIPDPDPTHTPVVPEPDPTHAPTIPDSDPVPPMGGDVTAPVA